MVVVMMLVIL